MTAVLNYLKTRLACRKGQGMVEYGLIVAVIVVIIVVVFGFLRTPLENLFKSIGDYLSAHPVSE